MNVPRIKFQKKKMFQGWQAEICRLRIAHGNRGHARGCRLYLVVRIGRRRRGRCAGEEGGGRQQGGELEAEALHVQPPLLLHVLPLQLAPPAPAAAAVRVRLPRGRAAPAALPPALHLTRPVSSALLSALACSRRRSLLPACSAVSSYLAFNWLGQDKMQEHQRQRTKERGWSLLCFAWGLAAGCSFIQVKKAYLSRSGTDWTEEGDDGQGAVPGRSAPSTGARTGG